MRTAEDYRVSNYERLLADTRALRKLNAPMLAWKRNLEYMAEMEQEIREQGESNDNLMRIAGNFYAQFMRHYGGSRPGDVPRKLGRMTENIV
jgi:hypothetical protein